MTLKTGKVHEVDAAAFNKMVREPSLPILLYIWAPWCPPCLPMGPEYEKAAAACTDVLFLKVNAATDSQLLTALNIASVPTLVLNDSNGVQVARFTGALTAPQIAALLERSLGSPAV
ncbi:TPA: thioredoxin family protein [Stenotrophomonas maltophilia]|uniref:Thioredoxin family protein n=1 Tax=Stenotrophomonas maltophilia TaxID=40324 RepID=A0AAJ2JB59_STEMA|nr:thioredoxin family protein [Stenotrophomonas maltophilia]MDT3468326.1 thioredoxin family protein [Stenotrophomonas maltophilia]